MQTTSKKEIFDKFMKAGKIALRESRHVMGIVVANKEDVSKHDESELVRNVNIPRFFAAALFGLGASTHIGKEIKIRNRKVVDNVTWFFINGICTTEELLEANCKYLSKIFGRTIIGIHNPTSGIIPDLVECAVSRVNDAKLEDVSIVAARRISVELAADKKVVLIGHSQGGIIVRNVLRKLKHDGIDIKGKLEVFTFSSAAGEEFEVEGVLQEHFVNEKDFVARIGLGAPEYRPRKLWERKGGTGHFLNKSYLTAFARGDFCNEESKLYSYLRDKEQAEKKSAHTTVL